MRKLNSIYKQLNDFKKWCAENNCFDDEQIRIHILELMHQVKGYRNQTPHDINTWFSNRWGIRDNIEWLQEPWQFRIVLDELLNTTPDEVKFLPNIHLGFSYLFE